MPILFIGETPAELACYPASPNRRELENNKKEASMAKLDGLLQGMKQMGASDLHLSSGSPPYMRIDGKLTPLKHRDLTAKECETLLFEILTEDHRKAFIENWDLDFVYSMKSDGRFRGNILKQKHGISAVFRIIPEKILSAEELGLPPVVLQMSNAHKGLILIVGSTGSGKTTTLAAIIDHINKTRRAHIITVEDPVEFVHDNQLSLITQRQVSLHTKSFTNALKAATREDPDIILVGEMRDLETISLAVTAAEMGHLVLGTLHTNSAPKTLNRVIDAFPTDQQAQIRVMISENLCGIVAQALLPHISGKGRVPVFEILRNTSAIGNLIREEKTFQIPSAMQVGKGLGMITFEQAIADLIKNKKIKKSDGMKFLGKDAEAQKTNPQPETKDLPKAG